ncbi:GTP cyclohydrolase I FolE [Rhodoligotrophos defluvii]|uniref:GTP cyclohydrolase I FolE n=1 Tax=Rhodoligotrophos defluvii TaxID=2561934 RepID=UPI0010C97EAB|nr:GTP cyclohydrolase I FolE [Rhodoligotrophos defluvii]
MDAIVSLLARHREDEPGHAAGRPTREEAEAAVRTLIRWAGDDPKREGLAETPERVVRAYREFFKGYGQDPLEILSRTFEETAGYDDMVLVRDIEVASHCEHHMVPFVGKAHVAYLPSGRVVGLSKIARVVEVFARRLQTQETMTAQIADAMATALKPRGVAVLVDAVHQCMSLRGVQKPNVSTITTQFTGAFKADAVLQARFFELIRHAR